MPGATTSGHQYFQRLTTNLNLPALTDCVNFVYSIRLDALNGKTPYERLREKLVA